MACGMPCFAAHVNHRTASAASFETPCLNGKADTCARELTRTREGGEQNTGSVRRFPRRCASRLSLHRFGTSGPRVLVYGGFSSLPGDEKCPWPRQQHPPKATPSNTPKQHPRAPLSLSLSVSALARPALRPCSKHSARLHCPRAKPASAAALYQRAAAAPSLPTPRPCL